MAATSRPETRLRADPSRLRRSRPGFRLGWVVGHDGAASGCGPGDGVRRVEHPAASRSCGGPEKTGVRGGAAPRQPPQGTHGVWPRGVRWLVHISGQTDRRGVASPLRRRRLPIRARILSAAAFQLLDPDAQRRAHLLARCPPSRSVTSARCSSGSRRRWSPEWRTAGSRSPRKLVSEPSTGFRTPGARRAALRERWGGSGRAPHSMPVPWSRAPEAAPADAPDEVAERQHRRYGLPAESREPGPPRRPSTPKKAPSSNPFSSSPTWHATGTRNRRGRATHGLASGSRGTWSSRCAVSARRMRPS